jgi:hypothetical protein
MDKQRSTKHTHKTKDQVTRTHIFKSWLAVFVCVLGVNSTNNIYHNDKTNILSRPVPNVSTSLCVCNVFLHVNNYMRNKIYFYMLTITWENVLSAEDLIYQLYVIASEKRVLLVRLYVKQCVNMEKYIFSSNC